MRITETLVYSRLRRETGQAQARYDAATLPLMTGQNATRPSEDPSLAAEMAHLDRGMHRSEQWQKAIDRLDSYYGVVESHVQSAVDLLGAMETRAIQMKNDSYSATDRLHAAQEVKEALGTLTALSSARQDGRYVFSGRAESSPPYDAAGAYQGDPTGRVVPISDGVTIAGDMLATDVFGESSGTVSAFRALKQFQEALEKNDGPAIDAAILALHDARELATRAWTRVGSLRSELSQVESFHGDQHAAYETRKSHIGTVDFASAATQLRSAEDVYSASVAVSQRVADAIQKALNL